MKIDFQKEKRKVITFCDEHSSELILGSILTITIVLLCLEKEDSSKKSKIIAKQALEITNLTDKNLILTEKLSILDKMHAEVSSESLRLGSPVGGKMMAIRRYAPLC